MRWLLISALVSVAVYGIWYADSEGVLDWGRDAFQAGQDSASTSTAPTTWESDDDAASGQEWSDKWVAFTLKPQVCNGLLEFRGVARNGARVSYQGSASAAPFALYKRSALAPRPGIGWAQGVDPIAIFLKPLFGNEQYPPMNRSYMVARILTTPLDGEFRAVVFWADWLPDHGEVALGVWGYRPDYGEDGLRLVNIEDCQK